MFGVKKFPWVQVPAGEIGVVIAQVGEPLPIGAKSAQYKTVFGNFSSLREFVEDGGQKGVQRPGARPRARSCRSTRSRSSWSPPKVCTGCRCHPSWRRSRRAGCSFRSRSVSSPEQLRVVVIAPDGVVDVIGVVTTLEGPPLPSGDIASRLGGFDDISRDGSARRRRAGRRPHRGAARQQERPAQQLPGLSGVHRRRAARSGCSTTRSSTARTC